MAIQRLDNAGQRELVSTVNLSKGGLAINAASSPGFRTTNTLTYAIKGVLYTKAAMTAQPLTVTHGHYGKSVTEMGGNPAYVQPGGTTVIYVLSLDAAGNVLVSQGAYAGQEIAFNGNLSKRVTDIDGGVPMAPNAAAVFGAIKVTTADGTTFTPTSTALDSAGVTSTFFDLQSLPVEL